MFTLDDIIDLTMSAMGVHEIVQWPVIKGNTTVIMNFPRRMVTRARLGDRIGVTGGGYVERVSDDGWLQWQYHWDGEEPDPDAPPRRDPPAPLLPGRLLRGSPVTPTAPLGERP